MHLLATILALTTLLTTTTLALPQQQPAATPTTNPAYTTLVLSDVRHPNPTPPPGAVAGGDPNHCTMTLRVPVVLSNLGPTSTVHALTVTKTHEVDCGVCAFLSVLRWGGHGPVAHHTATVLASTAKVVEAWACAAGGGGEGI